MKNVFVLLCFFFLSSYTRVAAQDIQFDYSGDLESAQKKAAQTGKIIFIDVYATWCGPCKMLDRTVFNDSEVSELMNAFFIPLKADAESTGKKIAKSYNVKSYPTMLFVLPDGNLLHLQSGFTDKMAFMNLAKSILRRTEYGMLYLLVEGRWASGDYSAPTAYMYFKLRKAYGLPNTDLLDDMLKHLPKDSLDTPFTQKVVCLHATTIKGRAFDYLIDRKEQPRFQEALRRVIQQHKQLAIKDQSEKQLNKVAHAAQLAASTPELGDLQAAQIRMEYALETKHTDQFHKLAAAYIPTTLIPLLQATPAEQRQPFEAGFESMLWQYTQFVHDKAQLQEALRWLDLYVENVKSENLLLYRGQLADLVGK